MDRDGIQRAFDDVFDQALVFHGYADYMRDQELLTDRVADPRTGVATVVVTRFLDRAAAGLDGYVWGVRWQALHPGATLLPASPKAASWSRRPASDSTRRWSSAARTRSRSSSPASR